MVLLACFVRLEEVWCKMKRNSKHNRLGSPMFVYGFFLLSDTSFRLLPSFKLMLFWTSMRYLLGLVASISDYVCLLDGDRVVAPEISGRGERILRESKNCDLWSGGNLIWCCVITRWESRRGFFFPADIVSDGVHWLLAVGSEALRFGVKFQFSPTTDTATGMATGPNVDSEWQYLTCHTEGSVLTKWWYLSHLLNKLKRLTACGHRTLAGRAANLLRPHPCKVANSLRSELVNWRDDPKATRLGLAC